MNGSCGTYERLGQVNFIRFFHPEFSTNLDQEGEFSLGE